MAIEKPHNGGTWTKARLKSFIISQLRGATQRWGPKVDCIKKARVSRGLYRCAGCGEVVPPTLPPPDGKKRRIKNIVADHIETVVPMEGFTTYDDWIRRCFVEAEGYQALCHKCHTEKTEEEKRLRKCAVAKSKEHYREYCTWRSMLARCTNPNHDAYHRYGGAGILVCKSWENFETFYSDMGERPIGSTLDRIDNSGGYNPDNCKWSTYQEQANNRSNSVYLELKGETKTLSAWSEELGIPKSTINNRLLRGDSVEKALSLSRKRAKRPSLLPIEEIMLDHELGADYSQLAEKYNYSRDYIRKSIATERKKNDTL